MDYSLIRRFPLITHTLLRLTNPPTHYHRYSTDKPFYMLGYGNGGNIASFYGAFYNNPNVRALVLLNSYSYVDPHLASVLHDCMNVFSCSPPNRPDLPIYFFARFLFSPTYLSSVSTPLALNLYTAVHNPISIKSRIQLCLGALSHTDLRDSLKDIPYPIINVQSTQDALVRPLHTDAFVQRRDGEVRSIHRCLQSHFENPLARKTCLVWVNSGHEVFQEKRNQALQLIEQLVIGYHESADVAFMPAMSVDREAAVEMNETMKTSLELSKSTTASKRKALGNKSLNSLNSENFEDKFVDDVIGKLGKITQQKKRAVSIGGMGGEDEQILTHDQIVNKENAAWEQYKSVTAKSTSIGVMNNDSIATSGVGGRGKRVSKYSTSVNQSSMFASTTNGHESVVRIVTDPTRANFEKNNKTVYGFKKDNEMYSNPEDYPEVQEYMGWRLKRNKKRLARLDGASRIIQAAYRAHLAWLIITKLRQERAIIYIQRCYRGWKGRLEFLDRMRLVWAAQIVQRNWRGHQGREDLMRRRIQSAAVTHIQRVFRGHVARKIVGKLHEARWKGACALQSCWRKRKARSVSKTCNNP